MDYFVLCIVIGIITAPFCFSAMRAATQENIDSATAWKWGIVGCLFMGVGAIFVYIGQPEHGVNLQAFVFRLISAACYFVICAAAMAKGIGIV